MSKFTTAKQVEDVMIDEIKQESEKLSLEKTRGWQKMIKHLKPLIKTIADKYTVYGSSIDELLKAGEKGALIALDLYLSSEERTERFKFSTYASWFIRAGVIEKTTGKPIEEQSDFEARERIRKQRKQDIKKILLILKDNRGKS